MKDQEDILSTEEKKHAEYKDILFEFIEHVNANNIKLEELEVYAIQFLGDNSIARHPDIDRLSKLARSHIKWGYINGFRHGHEFNIFNIDRLKNETVE